METQALVAPVGEKHPAGEQVLVASCETKQHMQKQNSMHCPVTGVTPFAKGKGRAAALLVVRPGQAKSKADAMLPLVPLFLFMRLASTTAPVLYCGPYEFVKIRINNS